MQEDWGFHLRNSILAFSLLNNLPIAECLGPSLNSHLGREGIFLISVYSAIYSLSHLDSSETWNHLISKSYLLTLFVLHLPQSAILFSVPMTISYMLWMFSFNFFEKMNHMWEILHYACVCLCCVAVCIRERGLRCSNENWVNLEGKMCHCDWMYKSARVAVSVSLLMAHVCRNVFC